MKGVVRAERLDSPADFIQPILERVKAVYIQRQYGVGEWVDHFDFLSKVALKSGRVLKGGEPDINTIAINVINDWQRGKLPYFVAPPRSADDDDDEEGGDEDAPLVAGDENDLIEDNNDEEDDNEDDEAGDDEDEDGFDSDDDEDMGEDDENEDEEEEETDEPAVPIQSKKRTLDKMSASGKNKGKSKKQVKFCDDNDWEDL